MKMELLELKTKRWKTAIPQENENDNDGNEARADELLKSKKRFFQIQKHT